MPKEREMVREKSASSFAQRRRRRRIVYEGFINIYSDVD